MLARCMLIKYYEGPKLKDKRATHLYNTRNIPNSNMFNVNILLYFLSFFVCVFHRDDRHETVKII